jgi:hypothetical protein
MNTFIVMIILFGVGALTGRPAQGFHRSAVGGKPLIWYVSKRLLSASLSAFRLVTIV